MGIINGLVHLRVLQVISARAIRPMLKPSIFGYLVDTLTSLLFCKEKLQCVYYSKFTRLTKVTVLYEAMTMRQKFLIVNLLNLSSMYSKVIGS